MGNRAHVLFESNGDVSAAVYLHWNGGAESVYPFLDEMDKRGRCHDAHYAVARFAQIVGEFFDSSGRGVLSLGITNGPREIRPAHLGYLDHGDNSIYVVSYNGKDRTVRRFTGTGTFDTGKSKGVREWTEAEVEDERKCASNHSYSQPSKDGDGESLPEFFDRVRNILADPKSTGL